MDAVAPRGEEDRMRHAGIVPFLRVVHDLHAEGRVGTIRSREAGSSGRDRPAVKQLPIDRDGHDLARLVDLDEDISEGGRARGASKARDDKSDGEKPKAPHPADFPQGWWPHGISLISIWAPTKGPIWAASTASEALIAEVVDGLQIGSPHGRRVMRMDPLNKCRRA